MAGHNKWSKVKRSQGALDAKRGKLFSKLAKEITLAARTDAGSPEEPSCLRGTGATPTSTLEAATDNKSSAAQALRTSFCRAGGHLASSSSGPFHQPGPITIPREWTSEDEMKKTVFDAGTDEVSTDDEHHLVVTAFQALHAMTGALKKALFAPGALKPAYLSDNQVTINEDLIAAQFLRLSDALEDHDDHVHAHAKIAEANLSRIDG